MLWASPWALIGCFVVWNLSGANAGYMRARLMWQLHQREFVATYLAGSDALQRGDMNSASIASRDAEVAISRLETDMRALSGAPDHGRKELFLERASRCLNDSGMSGIYATRKPDPYCVRLIKGGP
jgi:hypothetical protein